MKKLSQRYVDHGVSSGMAGSDVRPAESDPLTKTILEAADRLIAFRILGERLPPVDPATGLVLDPSPTLLPETEGLEELDAKEVYRHRYSGQYPGRPESHFLGGSDDITFGGGRSEISESWDRLKDIFTASSEQKAWRNAYHQIGFITDRLDLPEPIKEDICRAYADLRDREISEAYSLEKLLGLLTYVACRIHDYPRDFDDVAEAIDELYGLEIEKDNVSRDMVKAFNKGPIRFGVSDISGHRYLYTWKRTGGEQLNHKSLGRI